MLLLAASLAVPTADAGNVYINGVQANGLTNFELSEVDVKIDARGDVYIDAPRYSIEIISNEPAPVPEPEPEATPDAVVEVAPEPAPVAPIVAPPEQPVPPESWWLVSQDNGSTGHVVDVFVGGQPVATIQSGDAQVMLDISVFLVPGDNTVNFNARPGQPAGGLFELYIGAGNNLAGTLELEAPSIVFARRASDDPAGSSQQYTLSVPASSPVPAP